MKMSARRFFSSRNIISAAVVPLLFIFAAGCQGGGSIAASPPAPSPARMDEPAPPPRAEIPTHAYRGDRFADPFVPLSVSVRSSSQGELVIPNINSLSLKGIYASLSRTIAILSDGGLAYTIKGNRLYDSRERAIPGFWCSIKTESAVISAGGITREIKLRE
ncbi:MAG: hypothetical protein QME32_02160 [Endomicrobiia bacterium]|nr:hypothetical protein [Endomicrobiia bacterium]